MIWDITARREAGIRRPVRAVVRRDLVPNLWSLGVVPVLIYIGTWWAWFASETGWPRHTLVAVQSNRRDWKSGALYEMATPGRTRCGSGPGRCSTSTPTC